MHALAPAIFSEPQSPAFTDYALPILVADESRIVPLMREVGLDTVKLAGKRPPSWNLALAVDVWACVRILNWELDGVTTHRHAGLPHAPAEIRKILEKILDEAMKPNSTEEFGHLGEKVYRLMLENFAWAGPQELNTEIEFDPSDDDDTFVEKMALFLWENRGRHVKDETC
jgi:hypothetical protein